MAFKPPDPVADGERPEVIVVALDADRLSALTVLANFGRESDETVIAPFGAGCQTVGIFAGRRASEGCSKAVVGPTDISARLGLAKQLWRRQMSLIVRLSVFDEMEAKVPGSFLELPTWKNLIGGEADRSSVPRGDQVRMRDSIPDPRHSSHPHGLRFSAHPTWQAAAPAPA